MDSVLIAHVADSIERISGGEAGNYDATADFANELLLDNAEVRNAAAAYMAGTVEEARLDEVVGRAAAKTGK
jgi:hypothetical protein